MLLVTWLIYYRKRGSASYIVREVRSARERDTERESEWDGSDVTLVALKLARNFAPFVAKTLKLAMNFALFLAKNMHLSFSPLEGRWVHTFCCQKRCALQNSSCSSFCFCQMAWQGIEAPKQTIEFPAAPSFFSSKKWIKLTPKTTGNIKRDCEWGCARRINTTSENLQIEKHKSGGRSFRSPDRFVNFRSAGFLRWSLSSERNLTHNLFFYFQYFLVLIYFIQSKKKKKLKI